MNNKDLASMIIKYVGGKENIESVLFCSTRLRFILKDKKNVKKEEINNLKGVLGVVEGQGQFQVVIGSHVSDVHKEVSDMIGEGNTDVKSNRKIGQKLLDYVSNAFIPMVPALVGSGMLKGFLALFTSFGWMSATSTTYAVLTAAGNAVFYFIPFMIAYNTAKYLKTNVLIAMVIIGALLEPNFTGLAAAEGSLSLFGIPLVVIDYSSLIFPALFMTPILAIIEKYLKKFIPKSLQLLIVPFLSILIMVPLISIVIGPVSQSVSDVISNFSLWLNDTNPILLGVLVGGTVGYLTMFGIHLSLLPVILLNFTNLGYDPVLAFMSATCYAQIGIGFAIFLRSKNKQIKSLAGVSSITALLSGITEPILFGICVEYKKSYAVIGIAGAMGGALMGVFNCAAYGFVNAGILGFPGYYSDTFIYYILSITVTTVAAFALMNLFAFKNEAAPVQSNKIKTIIKSPVGGRSVPLSDLRDDVFASEMVGKGIAVSPDEGKIYAPQDGTIISLMPLNHAIGLKLDNNVELMIHVGLNTVQLESGCFKSHFKLGDSVKEGDLLLEFDIHKIREKGYDTITPVVITNSSDFKDVVPLTIGEIKQGGDLLEVIS